MKRSRFNYWSCSKLADMIRGASKPYSASLEDWNEWHTNAKHINPIRYWIAEEALDAIQDFVNLPTDTYYSIRYYIQNRWVTKTHALSSNLKKGDWWDMDSRILNCMFDTLVDFVEIELAQDWCRWSEENYKKYKVGGWRRRSKMSVQAGIENLIWQINNDECSDQQRASAQEILDLYRWWKADRPSRSDIYDTTGWSEYCDQKPFRSVLEHTDEDREKVKSMLDQISELEAQYEQEDTDMLIRLVKLRSSLWT